MTHYNTIKSRVKIYALILIVLVVLSALLPVHTVQAQTWLGTWAYRIPVTIDSANVDADLTNFPILLELSNSSGISNKDLTTIFTELGIDFLKLAVTTDDGITQCYVEVVSWDSLTPYAELHVNVPNVSSIVDEVLYLYYDGAHADNTDYVGITGSANGQAVWDANFVAVYHMNDTTTSTLTGSTSLNSAATKFAANNPVEGSYAPGKGQNFINVNSFVRVGDSASLSGLATLTAETYFNAATVQNIGLLSKDNGAVGTREWSLTLLGATTKLQFVAYSSNDANFLYAWGTTNGFSAWHYAAATYDGVNATGHIKLFLDEGVEALTADGIGGTGYTPWDGSGSVDIGKAYAAILGGQISEARLSNINRPDAYAKLTNYSLKDAAVTYGNSENMPTSAAMDQTSPQGRITTLIPLVFMAFFLFVLISAITESSIAGLVAVVIMIFIFYAFLGGIQSSITAMFGG